MVNAIILSGNIILNENNEIYLLFRNKHKHYETPGGKVEEDECVDFENPTKDELKIVAKRELLEEISGIKEIKSMEYFDCVEFIIPDGRNAIAHKFITKIIGDIMPKEALFDKEKSKWFKISELENVKISPDLELLLYKLKQKINNN